MLLQSKNNTPTDLPDVELRKDVVNNTAHVVGDEVIFRITVGLSSMSPANNVQMVDTLPEGLSIVGITENPFQRGKPELCCCCTCINVYCRC